jgi:hypothetical protein
MWSWRRATILEWQGIEFRILKLKLHSCTAYRVPVLVLEVGMDIGFRMLFKGLGPMEEARPLLVLHGNRGVTAAVNHPDSILVCLSTICHEALELGLGNCVPCHDIIQVLPEYHLSSSIL